MPLMVFVLVALCLCPAGTTLAGNLPESTPVPKDLTPGLQHLLKLVGPHPKPEFDQQAVGRVIEFVVAPKDPRTFYAARRDTGSPSAYYQSVIDCGLRQIIEYAFSPDIPLAATAPSSTRIVRWGDGGGGPGTLPRLGRSLVDLSRPVVIYGREYVVNTPDTNTGAYYDYEQGRALVLMEVDRRKVLISVSRQIGPSGPGRKGYVLGNDDNWDYLYSPDIGLNIKGLGWMRSHMFDSYGINFYIESADTGGGVLLGAFKWVRAGWNKINVVRDGHVHAGLERFAKAFKKILESPRLPSAPKLAAALAPIQRLSPQQLRQKMEIYRGVMVSRYTGQTLSKSEWPFKILNGPQHWNGLQVEEMRSALVLEKMKQTIGKSDSAGLERLLDFK